MNRQSALALAFSSCLAGLASLDVLPGQDRSQDGGDARLAAEIERIVRGAESDAVRCGVAVLDLAANRILVERRAREAFIPASNQKILTAVFVFRSLGLAHEFRTEFRLDASNPPRLQVRASGDPTLSQLRLRGESPFRGVVEALRERGVTTLGGVDLVAGAWTGPSRPADWPKNQLRRYYAAPTGPFVLEEGCFVVGLTPTRDGSPARVTVEPAGCGVRVDGRVMTTSSRKRGRAPIVSPSKHGARLSGAMWTGFGTNKTRIADPDPVRSYESALRTELRRGGIEFSARSAQAVEASVTGRDRPVYTLRSPLAWSLQRLLRDSSNFQAEQLLRVVAAERGAAATLANGTRLFAEKFAAMPGSEELVVRDGSGLSRGNRISPRLMTSVLRDALLPADARQKAQAKAFLDLFPVAGVNGTIRDRMRRLRGRVRAKTGWIRGASALSGVVLTKRDRIVAFSILMNYAPSRDGLNKNLKATQDRIVQAIHDDAR